MVIFLDIRQLETFVQVAKLRSFSKAAEKLYITQPTVTGHIQNLEREFGTILINRSGKKTSLTEAGSLLYKYALNIINTSEMAKFQLDSYKGRIQGHLDICSSSVPRKYLLPKIIKEFMKKYPNITFSLSDKDSKEVVKSILDGENDFGIVGAKYLSNNLKYLDILQDKILLVTPNNKNFPAENYSYLDKDIIFSQNIIMREKGSGTRELLEKELKKHDMDLKHLKVISIIEDTETIKNLVRLGVGISFLSERAIKNELELNQIKVFNIKDLDLFRKFYFVYHKNRQLSPLGETFKNFVLDYLKNQAIE